MEFEPQNFENIDIGRDVHMILTSKFMSADYKANSLLERGEDPYKIMEGLYGQHRYLAFESLILEPQFYIIGQEILEDADNLTRYLIYKCKKSDDHTLPFASTRQEFITHEDTILVDGDEHLYSLTNKFNISNEYNEELVSEISKFTLAIYWPEWAQNDDWMFYTY